MEVEVFAIFYKKRNDVFYNQYSTGHSFYMSTEFKEAYFDQSTAIQKVKEYRKKYNTHHWIEIKVMEGYQANTMCCDSEENQLTDQGGCRVISEDKIKMEAGIIYDELVEEIKKGIKVSVDKSTGKLTISVPVYLPGPTPPLKIDCADIIKGRGDNKTTTVCPKCEEECFVVTITGGGDYPDEFGTNHWFEGDGECDSCGYKGFYGDSSH